jgi:hypothetical protein
LQENRLIEPGRGDRWGHLRKKRINSAAVTVKSGTSSMKATRADAIHFLKSSIAGYRQRLQNLQPRGFGASNVVDFTQAAMEREQLNALIEDANSLLSRLRTG